MAEAGGNQRQFHLYVPRDHAYFGASPAIALVKDRSISLEAKDARRKR